MAKTKKKIVREPISKKLRFDVFKRDDFICQYCGQHPPAVILELDHINPVCNGGKNTEDNLITSCFDCNRGKGGELLTAIPQTVQEKREILAEKEEQLKEYNKLLKRKSAREIRTINYLNEIYQEIFEEWCMSESFKNTIRTKFLPHLTQEQLEKALRIAIWKTKDSRRSLKYFCGICWKVIRGDGDGSI